MYMITYRINIEINIELCKNVYIFVFNTVTIQTYEYHVCLIFPHYIDVSTYFPPTNTIERTVYLFIYVFSNCICCLRKRLLSSSKSIKIKSLVYFSRFIDCITKT